MLQLWRPFSSFCPSPCFWYHVDTNWTRYHLHSDWCDCLVAYICYCRKTHRSIWDKGRSSAICSGVEKAHFKKRFLVLCLYYTAETFWRSASNLSSAVEAKKVKKRRKTEHRNKKSKILYFCKLRLELFKILWSIA